jgi:methionyl aminopeptidase
MITIKNTYAQERMMKAGFLLAQLFELLKNLIEPGITTLGIDAFIERYLDTHKLKSSTRGYFGYQHVSCISVNDEVVHGIPRDTVLVKEGDMVKIDVCASYDGYCADMARSFFVGEPSEKVKQFVETAQEALDAGISQVRPGEKLGTVSAAIQAVVERNGFGVVRDFAGHGIGKKMHEDPEILNYGTAGTGPVIRSGMAFAIEPMITMGEYHVYVSKDGWTVKTVDKSLAAHVEDTVLVTERGPMIITRLKDTKSL